MKYSTSVLSKMLNVSANTIRRFADKGHLSPKVDESNQYRYFSDADVEKITYISKYRKIGFLHDKISQMMNGDIDDIRMIYEKRMKELDAEMERLKSLRHMVKDDVNMMKAVREYGSEIFEMNSVAVDYIVYKKDDVIYKESRRQKMLNQFLYDFPEIEYCYIFRKDDVLQRRLTFEEAVTIRSKLAGQKGLVMDREVVEQYPHKPSIMRILKLPLEYDETDEEAKKNLQKILFDDYFAYMEKHGYELDGDAFGTKISLSHEAGQHIQYVVFGMPVRKK